MIEEAPKGKKGKGKRKASEDAADTSVSKRKGRDSVGSVKRAASGTPDSIEPVAIRYYTTTRATISDKDRKALAKLGWRMEAEYTARTTLLIAGNLNRSEKMLSAIATGIDIVSEAWAKKSASKGEDLDLGHYQLKDKDGEKKWGINLATVLEKSRSRAKPLLEGHSFYFTKGMQPDPEVMRRIVTLAGGEAIKGDPMVDRLKEEPDRYHLISSETESKVWTQIEDVFDRRSKQVKVWDGSLILDGVFHQQVEWNKHKLLG